MSRPVRLTRRGELALGWSLALGLVGVIALAEKLAGMVG